MTRISEIEAFVDISFVRAALGGEDLSPEMVLLLALVIFDEYELFPNDGTRNRER